jgi:molybdate transport system permease protein
MEILLSLKLAIIATGILICIGFPIAYWLAFSKWRGKPFVEAIVSLPMLLPPTVLGFYLLLSMGPNGWMGKVWGGLFHQRLAFSFAGLVLASVVCSLPFTVQPLQATFQGINPRVLEASWTLGASRLRTFLRVILPSSMPGVLSAAVLSFAHILGEFGVVLMVGGNIPGQTRTVSIAIYDLVETLEYGKASWLCLFLLIMAYGILTGLYLFNRKVLQLWQRA